MHNMWERPRLAVMSFVGVAVKTNSGEGIQPQEPEEMRPNSELPGLILSIILLPFCVSVARTTKIKCNGTKD